MPVVAIAVLALGTFAFRLAGPLTRHRLSLSPRVEALLTDASVVLLVALVATSALTQAHGFAGVAWPVGVLVAGVLAWKRAPFPVIVIAAAGTTAVLRLLGVA